MTSLLFSNLCKNIVKKSILKFIDIFPNQVLNFLNIFTGNGSFRSCSRSDPGSFRSYSLSVRSFWPGSFRLDFRGGSFLPNFGNSAHFILYGFLVLKVIRASLCVDFMQV